MNDTTIYGSLPRRPSASGRRAGLLTLALLGWAASTAAQSHEELRAMLVIRYDPASVHLTRNLLGSLCGDRIWQDELQQALQAVGLVPERVAVQVDGSEVDQPPGVFAGGFTLRLGGVAQGSIEPGLRREALDVLADKLRGDLDERLTLPPVRSLRERSERLEQQLAAVRNRLGKLRVELPAEPRDDPADTFTRLAAIEVQLKGHEATQLRLQKLVAQTQDELDRTVAERQQAQMQLDVLRQQLHELEARLSQASTEPGRREAMRAELAELGAEAVRRESALEVATARRDQLSRRLDELTHKAQESLVHGHELREQAHALRDRADQLARQRAAQKEHALRRATLLDEMRSVEALIEQLEAARRDLREQLRTIREVTVEVW